MADGSVSESSVTDRGHGAKVRNDTVTGEAPRRASSSKLNTSSLLGRRVAAWSPGLGFAALAVHG